MSRSDETHVPVPAVAVGVGLLAFLLYATVTAPAAYLLDSAELAAASFGLGVAHPPGEPLALLWGKLFTFLPLGSVAFRVGIGQAAAGALAALLVFHLIVDLSPTPEGTSPAPRALCAAAGAILFAGAPGVVMTANRPEVYALQTMLSLGALRAALLAQRRHDPRWAFGAALLIALGVATHPLVAGLTGLAAVAAALPAWRATAARGRFFLLGVGVFVIGLAVLLYLPLRGAALVAEGHEAILWGRPDSWSGLWWVLSAHTFTSKAALVHAATDPTALPFLFMEELAIIGPFIALVGPFYLWRQPKGPVAVVALLLCLAGAATAALVGGLDPGNPDIRGYLGPALAATAVLFGVALTAAVAQIGNPRARLALATLLLLLPVLRLARPDRTVNLRQRRVSPAVQEAELADLPLRAAYFTSHFETAFLTAYQRLVRGVRPDVAWGHLGFAAQPGYNDRLARSDPDLMGIFRREGGADLSLPALSALDRHRPVRFEPDEHLPPVTRAQLRLTGYGAALVVASLPAPLPRLTPAGEAEARIDRQVRGFLGWRIYRDAVLACEVGQRAAFALLLAELQTLLPVDDRTTELRRSCSSR